MRIFITYQILNQINVYPEDVIIDHYLHLPPRQLNVFITIHSSILVILYSLTTINTLLFSIRRHMLSGDPYGLYDYLLCIFVAGILVFYLLLRISKHSQFGNLK